MVEPNESGENEELLDECTIPGPPDPAVLAAHILNREVEEENDIASYVEWQASDEKVSYLEKTKTERILGRELAVWDVRTDKSRYWVLSPPTNLYLQDDWISLDYLISFHVGLMTRVESLRERKASESDKDLLPGAWRRWEQAFEAADRADEAEEFQAVGMRCRECLLEFVNAVGLDSMVPEGEEQPKRGDFIHWSEYIANTIAGGSSSKKVRSYLKTISESTWELVNWLTHAKNAVSLDAHLAIDATKNVLQAFGAALVRHQRALPDRCPNCGSYRIGSRSLPEHDPPYAVVCKSCDWEEAGRVTEI
jgi:hypothetical protein